MSCGDGRYWIYVYELGLFPRECRGEKGVWLYVGETAHSREFRYEMHLKGYKASKWVNRYGSKPRPDLCDDVAPLLSRDAAKKVEEAVAKSLENRGYCVKWG